MSPIGGGALLKGDICVGKEQDDVELGRGISSNPDFQLFPPPKPQGGMKT